MNVTIINYNIGNLGSLLNSLYKACGDLSKDINVKVSSCPYEILNSDKVILPGVGDFSSCKKQLNGIPGMIESINEYVNKLARPFLGICIGMQLMAKKSYERGEHLGLNYINSEVIKIESKPNKIKVPHMGWNTVKLNNINEYSNFNSLNNKDFYFVHSFKMQCKRKNDVLASFQYGTEITAVVKKDNIIGVQFHPEKSQKEGQEFLKEFLLWSP